MEKSVLLVCAALEPSCVTADLVLHAALLGTAAWYGKVQVGEGKCWWWGDGKGKLPRLSLGVG